MLEFSLILMNRLNKTVSCFLILLALSFSEGSVFLDYLAHFMQINLSVVLFYRGRMS